MKILVIALSLIVLNLVSCSKEDYKEPSPLDIRVQTADTVDQSLLKTEQSQDVYIIYPNPYFDYVTIFSPQPGNFKITIIHENSRTFSIVQEGQYFTVDLSQGPAGYYLVEIEFNNKIYREQILKLDV